jgi:hypothetical protein
MGFIRGGLLTIVVVLLFLSLLAASMLLTLSLSLKYENIKPELTSVIRDSIEEGIKEKGVEGDFVLMQEYCENNSVYPLTEEDYSLEVPCETVDQGLDSVVEYLANALVDKAYYDDYDCDFWDCFELDEVPFFLISEKAKQYWSSKFYFALFASIVFASLTLLLVERKTTFPILLGTLMIVSALPLLKVDWLFILFGDFASGMISVLFSQAMSVFWIMAIVGGVLVVLGIILKVSLADYIKRKFSKEEVKQIVKQEVAKAKQEVKTVKKQAKPVEKPKKITSKKSK